MIAAAFPAVTLATAVTEDGVDGQVCIVNESKL
jgi:hypothetical protein